MSGADGYKVTAYLGERDTTDGRFIADRAIDAFASAGLEAGTLIRGVEGFGAKHTRRTDRLLTLSEDLPVVVTGVGEVHAVERAAETLAGLLGEGPITTEPVLIADATDPVDFIDADMGPWVKASVYVGRGRRIAGLPAHQAIVTRFRAAGVEGATVLVGVDGIFAGARQRAGFFSRNLDVPAIVVSVGSAGAIARGLSSLRALPGERLVAVERVHVCKSAGGVLHPPPGTGGPGLRKLTLYSSEQTHVGGRPAHIAAIREARLAGAAGATAMRGVWGFDRSHPPHGDTFRSIRRRVPTVTVIVDTPARSERWLRVLDELTPRKGLITSETVGAQPSRVAR